MTAKDGLEEQVLELKKQVVEIESRIQSHMPVALSRMPVNFNAKQMRYNWIPYGYMEKQEYRTKLENLKFEVQWANRVAPERVQDVKNKLMDFVSTHPWIDGKQFHAKVDPLLDEKFETLLKIHELELSESPGPVDNSRDGEDELPRQRQSDLGALEPPEAPDL
jgi:hypothetical protein